MPTSYKIPLQYNIGDILSNNFIKINFLTLVGLSYTLGRWLGMVVYIVNNTTPGCANFCLKIALFQ